MTIEQAHKRLLFRLYDLYSDREATNITELVMEKVTEWKKIDRVMNRQVPLSLPKQEQLAVYTEALLSGRPVQYVLGEAWFYAYPFMVNEAVLIPRPETEELVQWILDDVKNGSLKPDSRILDIGTGSGCIPITLQKQLREATLFAADISKEALAVAKQNADALQARLSFIENDFLDETGWASLPQADILVSNPPYIPQSESQEMHPRVVAHEPHMALFVPNDDALIFYAKLAKFLRDYLPAHACLYAEIHESKAEAILACFKNRGFENVEIKKDLQEKERMVKLTPNPKH